LLKLFCDGSLAQRGGKEFVQQRIVENEKNWEAEEKRRVEAEEKILRTSKLDRLFASNTIFFALIPIFCTPIVGIALAVDGLTRCKHPKAKHNAKVMLTVSCVTPVIYLFIWLFPL
jgi:hypothetical protein